MVRWFKQLDGVLRGEAISSGGLDDDMKGVSLRGLIVVAVILNGLYGLSVGSFTAIRTGGDQLMQMVASAVKLPMLFGLTLLVTLPSLYVFSALVGARLRLGAVCRLLAAMMGVVAAVLASFAPIVVFFGISTTSYPFMKLLIVAICGVAGLLGLAFLLRTLQAMVAVESDLGRVVVDGEASAAVETAASHSSATESADAAASTTSDEASTAATAAGKIEERSTLDETTLAIDLRSNDRRARVVFRIWVLLFAVVGMQMSWILRPFIGHPDLAFAWFRGRESNFFTDVLDAIGKLMGL